MATKRRGIRKQFQVNAAPVKRAQTIFRARTETEAIERALDFALEQCEKNRMVAEANERFVKIGVEIKDVYEKLVH
jgi:hypothetical protein